MNQFVMKIANHIVNEVLIKGLGNSRTFQRFAVRTDASLKNMQKTGADSLNKTFEEVVGQQTRASSTSAQGAAAAGPPQPPLRGFPGFRSAFFKEIRKDFGGGK
jgi:hypothetical protein